VDSETPASEAKEQLKFGSFLMANRADRKIPLPHMPETTSKLFHSKTFLPLRKAKFRHVLTTSIIFLVEKQEYQHESFTAGHPYRNK